VRELAWLRRYGVQAMLWVTAELGFDSRQGQEIFLSPGCSVPLASYPIGTAATLPPPRGWVKRQGREAEDTISSSTEVKNA
jgi:hypothetical protein